MPLSLCVLSSAGEVTLKCKCSCSPSAGLFCPVIIRFTAESEPDLAKLTKISC